MYLALVWRESSDLAPSTNIFASSPTPPIARTISSESSSKENPVSTVSFFAALAMSGLNLVERNQPRHDFDLAVDRVWEVDCAAVRIVDD